MSTANFTITYAEVPGFPAGTVVASETLVVTQPDATTAPVTVAVGDLTATFVANQTGAYTAVITAFDATGAALATVSTTFTVVAPSTISLSLPASLSSTLS